MKFFHGPKESCGVFGVFGHKDAAKLTYFGLYAIQHRGRESAGIVSSTPFPDSGNYAAIGFCQESGVPLEMGVIRNHYVGRTFIEPVQSMRDFGVKVKLNPVREILNQKRVVIIEDSIIRGTTSKMRIKTLREAGAWEIHMLVSCPPHRYPCYYGIDFSTKGELIGSQRSVEETKNFIGLDSLCYLSLPGMLEATELGEDSFCLVCFNGKYPIQPKEGITKIYLEV